MRRCSKRRDGRGSNLEAVQDNKSNLVELPAVIPLATRACAGSADQPDQHYIRLCFDICKSKRAQLKDLREMYEGKKEKKI
jgi:hypothetical protein